MSPYPRLVITSAARTSSRGPTLSTRWWLAGWRLARVFLVLSGLTSWWVRGVLGDGWVRSGLTALMFGTLAPALVLACVRWRPGEWGSVGMSPARLEYRLPGEAGTLIAGRGGLTFVVLTPAAAPVNEVGRLTGFAPWGAIASITSGRFTGDDGVLRALRVVSRSGQQLVLATEDAEPAARLCRLRGEVGGARRDTGDGGRGGFRPPPRLVPDWLKGLTDRLLVAPVAFGVVLWEVDSTGNDVRAVADGLRGGPVGADCRGQRRVGAPHAGPPGDLCADDGRPPRRRTSARLGARPRGLIARPGTGFRKPPHGRSTARHSDR